MAHRRLLELQAVEACRQIEDYLNSDFQNDKRRRRVEVGAPSAMAIQKHLRRYAESWVKANYRIKNWPLREQLEKDNSQKVSLFQASPDPLMMNVEGKSILAEPLDQKPSVIHWDLLDLSIPPEEFEENPDLEAQLRASKLFFDFITSKFWDRLKVCDRCDRFFINTTGHQNKVFCSRSCSKTQTALVGTRELRKQKYRDEIEKVEEAISEYRRLPDAERRRFHWKFWVAKKAGRDQRFITQAINRGNLTLPPGLHSQSTEQDG